MPAMDDPRNVLIAASLKLYAHGYNNLAADLKQLAKKYTPPEQLISDLPLQQQVDVRVSSTD